MQERREQNRRPKTGAKKILTSKREQEILAAAVRIFSRKGFNGATTKEIAAEAGVAEGTIFRYFKTKKDLLLGMVGPYLVETLETAIEEVSGKTDEVILKAILRNRSDLIKKNLDLIRLLLAEGHFHPELREIFAEKVIIKAAGVLEQLITDRVRQGEFKDIDPGIATRIFAGMMVTFVLWKTYLPGEKFMVFNDEEVIDNIVEIFLHGITSGKGKVAAGR